MKLKLCSSCGAEIAKSAKLCPHCGGHISHNIEFIVKIIAGLIIFNGISFLLIKFS